MSRFVFVRYVPSRLHAGSRVILRDCMLREKLGLGDPVRKEGLEGYVWLSSHSRCLPIGLICPVTWV